VLVEFPDGTKLLAHGRLDVVPPARHRDPDMALYLDRRWTTDPVVTWPYTFVAWDDFELPDDEHELFRALISIWEQLARGSSAQPSVAPVGLPKHPDELRHRVRSSSG